MSKLLIIEDDQILIKMYTNKFKLGGYQVLTSINGEEGIKQAIEMKPDFIILDLMMPKIDGFEVLKTLKNNPLTIGIPIAILSVMQQDLAEKTYPDLKNSIAAYWRKDEITPSEVLERVDKYLKED